jgi:hypothetical protein
VLLGQAIREVGAEEVKVRLTKNVVATVTVNVTPLGGEEEAAEATEAKPEDVLVQNSAAASDAIDADLRRQAAEGSQGTGGDTSVGVEAVAEAVQVAEPQAVAEVAAPDEEELENTGEPD